MELLKGIETRKSCRAFKSDPVARETIEAILKAAGRSPSYTNTQPWEVAVISGKKKDDLQKLLYKLVTSRAVPNPDLPAPKSWPAELEKRVKEHTERRFKVLGVDPADEQRKREFGLKNFEFYGAPCVLLLFMDSTLSSWSLIDIGLFAQDIALAANSFGLGSCLQASLALYPDAVRDFLGIPKTKMLVLGISLGYPEPDAPANRYRSTRISLGDFAQWYI